MNSRPSSPLCGNCLMTELYCQAVRELDRRACCGQCEHSLPPEPDEA